MHLVKLGGSVLTDKKELHSFRSDVAKRLIVEVKKSGEDTILVHGAGSFGHILASKYGLQNGFTSKDQIEGVSIVQHDVRVLNEKIVSIALESGLHPVSIPPASVVICKNKKIIEFNNAPFESSSRLGLTPVTFGDVVFDSKLGFCIASGDDLMFQLSKRFRPQKVIFVTDTDGVFDRNPKAHDDSKLLRYIDQGVLDGIRVHEAQCESCNKTDAKDATGGILRKIEIMLQISQLGIESIILNGLQPDRLSQCMSGSEVEGTIVKGKT
jgi:isopentenyl phosphate kinase